MDEVAVNEWAAELVVAPDGVKAWQEIQRLLRTHLGEFPPPLSVLRRVAVQLRDQEREGRLALTDQGTPEEYAEGLRKVREIRLELEERLGAARQVGG